MQRARIFTAILNSAIWKWDMKMRTPKHRFRHQKHFHRSIICWAMSNFKLWQPSWMPSWSPELFPWTRMSTQVFYSYLRSHNLSLNVYHGHDPTPTSPKRVPLLCTSSMKSQVTQDIATIYSWKQKYSPRLTFCIDSYSKKVIPRGVLC